MSVSTLKPEPVGGYIIKGGKLAGRTVVLPHPHSFNKKAASEVLASLVVLAANVANAKPCIEAWRYRDGNWYDEYGVRMSEDNWDVVKAVYAWKKIWNDAKTAHNAITAATTGAYTDRGNAPDALCPSSNLNGDGKSGFSTAD